MPVPTSRCASRPSTDVAPRASSRRGTGIPPGDPEGLTLTVQIAPAVDLRAARMQLALAAIRTLRARGEDVDAYDLRLESDALVSRAMSGHLVTVTLRRLS